MEEPGDELSPLARTYRTAGPWLAAVWKLIGGLLVGTVGGWFLDSKAGTGPAGLVVGALVGLGVGFYAFLKAVLALSQKKAGPKQ